MGEVYGLPRHLFDEETIERVGGAARRAREVDRGRGARDGEHLSRGRAAAAGRACRTPATSTLRQVPGAARAVHAVHARDRRARRRAATKRASRRRACAGSWGADRRRAALLRRQVRQSARVDRRHAGADDAHSPLRDGRASRSSCYDPERETRAARAAPARRVSRLRARARGRADRRVPGRACADKARRVLAEALARGEARHPGARRTIRSRSRRFARRIGARAARRRSSASPSSTALYEQQLADVDVDVSDFRHARLRRRRRRDRAARGARAVRCRCRTSSRSAGARCEIQYDVEETRTARRRRRAAAAAGEDRAHARPRKSCPTLDRPLRFVVTRGARGAARGDTLDELQDELDRPFTDAGDRRARAAHDGAKRRTDTTEASPRPANAVRRVVERARPSGEARDRGSDGPPPSAGASGADAPDQGPQALERRPAFLDLDLETLRPVRLEIRAPCSSAARAASRACRCAATRAPRPSAHASSTARVSIALPRPRPMKSPIEPEVRDLDASSSWRSQLEEAGGLVADETLPDDDVRAREVRGESLVGPRGAIVPVPALADVAIEAAIVGRTGMRVATNEAHVRVRRCGGRSCVGRASSRYVRTTSTTGLNAP